jgi:hypothetical protein
MAETTPGFAAGDDDGATDDPEPGASPPEEPTCALCGGRIGPDDVVCPHCGASLVAG